LENAQDAVPAEDVDGVAASGDTGSTAMPEDEILENSEEADPQLSAEANATAVDNTEDMQAPSDNETDTAEDADPSIQDEPATS
jgi:hypothetical protein